MRVDHIAVATTDLPTTIAWYVQNFAAEVLYRDDSWAFLKVGGTKLALLSGQAHPPHMAFSVTEEKLQELAMQYEQVVRPHRDGTSSIYIKDPCGNAVEFIAYPPGHIYKT